MQLAFSLLTDCLPSSWLFSVSSLRKMHPLPCYSVGEWGSLFCAGGVSFSGVQTLAHSLPLGGKNATACMLAFEKPSWGSVISHFITLVLSKYQGIQLAEHSILLSSPVLRPSHRVTTNWTAIVCRPLYIHYLILPLHLPLDVCCSLWL